MVPVSDCWQGWFPLPRLLGYLFLASPTNLLGTSSQAHQLVRTLKVKWRWDSRLKVYWTVQNADCSLTADHCFHGSKAMGLLLSCSHLHGENNGLQQSAVCTDWKVYMGCGMPEIAIEIMGLNTNDQDDGIDENYWEPSGQNPRTLSIPKPGSKHTM